MTVRSKARIDMLIDGIVTFATKYPQLSSNTICVLAEWTQSSFNRAVESRGLEMPTRDVKTVNVITLLGNYAQDQDYDAIKAFHEAKEELLACNTAELPEPEVEEVEEVESEGDELEDVVDDGEDFE